MNAKAVACALMTLGVVFGTWSRGAARAQTPPPGNSLLLLAPGDIQWQPTARPDTMRANLRGDSAKGAFEYFSRYDGGWQLPPHFHNNDLRGLILAGTLIIQPTGQPAKELPAGSYFSVPGKTRHTDACKAGPACIVFFTGDAPLDLIRVDAP
jgi:hypothetical protein